LQPDEVGPADGFGVPPAVAEHRSPVSVLWWD
jgi:hypothetical protein